MLRNHVLDDFGLENELVGLLNFELGIDSSDCDTNCSTPMSSGNFGYTDTFDYDNTPVNNETPMECPICQKICKSNKGLQQHQAKVHNQTPKKEVCKECGKCFKHKNALKFHVRQVHEKSTRVSCSYCGESIYNKYMLASHIKQSHESALLLDCL